MRKGSPCASPVCSSKSASSISRISPPSTLCPFARMVATQAGSKSCPITIFKPALARPISSPIAPENREITSRFEALSLKCSKSIMPSYQTFSPSGRTKWRSKEHPTVSARYSKSEIVKLSRFIFELKFCGVVPIRLASSATLILERTHSTLICSDIVIRVLLVNYQFLN